MTDLRKAAEMALEVLTLINQDIEKHRATLPIRRQPELCKASLALRQALAQPVQVLTAKVVVTGIEHESWCDSVTKLLLSMPPQIPPCNCKLKNEQGNSRPNYPISESNTPLDKIVELAIQGHASTRDAIRWAMQQEPVAWMWKDGSLTSDPDEADGTWIKLYTAPPKREWVGIDEKEVAWLWFWMGNREKINGYEFAKTIEAKLKERNCG